MKMATKQRSHMTCLHLWEHLASLHLISEHMGSTRLLWHNMCPHADRALLSVQHRPLNWSEKYTNGPAPSVQFKWVLPWQRHPAILMSKESTTVLICSALKQGYANILFYEWIKQQKRNSQTKDTSRDLRHLMLKRSSSTHLTFS